MILAVASGKGGTGKTTIATSLSLAIADLSPIYFDCDVESPNAHLYLDPIFQESRIVTIPIPEVDGSRCEGCGRCAKVCQYHAIVALDGDLLIFPELCHGCGSCTLQCPEQAIQEIPNPCGRLEAGTAKAGIRFERGVLDIGQPMAVPILRALKAWEPFKDETISIRDAPPGTSCPVVETIAGADFVLLVTEPTPFGLHDLKLAVDLVRQLELPIGVVINRDGAGNSQVDAYCRHAGVPVLMRIPMDLQIARCLASGIPSVGWAQAGKRYTPFEAIIEDTDTTFVQSGKFNEKMGKYLSSLDLNFQKHFHLGSFKYTLFCEITNLFDRKNATVINPLTGDAYRKGDIIPYGVNNLLLPEFGSNLPFWEDPARYSTPRNIKLGMAIKW